MIHFSIPSHGSCRGICQDITSHSHSFFEKESQKWCFSFQAIEERLRSSLGLRPTKTMGSGLPKEYVNVVLT